ncbi:hypothetical protein ScPMuIL_005705 [Solemya velum]
MGYLAGGANSDCTIIGVRVNSKHDGEVDIYAHIIVSDAGLNNTFTKLLPTEIASRTSFHTLLEQLRPSVASLTVFIGLKGSPEELGLKKQNAWIFHSTDPDAAMKKLMAMSADDAVDAEHPFVFLSFPSAKDRSLLEDEDKATAVVLLFANYDWFKEWETRRQNNRGDEYEDLKQRMGHRAWEQCCKVFPHLEDTVDYFNVGTPITNRYYLGQQRGEMYGVGVEKRYDVEVSMHIRPETEVPGLFLTGQDILSAGFTPTLLSGVLCSSAILKRNLFADLGSFHGAIMESK